MKIQIVSLAKSGAVELKSLEEDYRRRLSRSCKTEFCEIKRSSVTLGSVRKDWEKIERQIGRDRLIILDEKGRSFSSHELSGQLDKWLGGGRDISFVVGGPEGFPEEIKKKADMLLSLSPLTFPHKLVRLILLEALYRANDILKGGPYHRE